MTDHLHPQRETYPLVNTDDELVMVFRHHLPPTHVPVLYLKGLNPTDYRIDSSRTLDDRAGFVVLDYTAGSLDTVSITVNGGGATVLTEGTEFDAVVSNEETAIQIADAINTAALGLDAVADGTSVYVTPGVNSGVKEFTLDSSDFAAWDHRILASIGTLETLATGETTEEELPSATTDPLKTVSILRLFKGRVSADLRSPVEVRTYFRQPAVLRQTTGHPGGWPNTP